MVVSYWGLRLCCVRYQFESVIESKRSRVFQTFRVCVISECKSYTNFNNSLLYHLLLKRVLLIIIYNFLVNTCLLLMSGRKKCKKYLCIYSTFHSLDYLYSSTRNISEVEMTDLQGELGSEYYGYDESVIELGSGEGSGSGSGGGISYHSQHKCFGSASITKIHTYYISLVSL